MGPSKRLVRKQSDLEYWLFPGIKNWLYNQLFVDILTHYLNIFLHEDKLELQTLLSSELRIRINAGICFTKCEQLISYKFFWALFLC